VVGVTVALTAIELSNRPIGFKTRGVKVFSVNIKPGTTQLILGSDSRGKFPLSQAASDIIEQLSSTTGIASVAIATSAPLVPETGLFRLQPHDRAESIAALSTAVTPSYFSTVGATFVAGRPFADTNMTGDPSEAVLTSTLVRQLWGNQPDVLNKVIDVSDPVSGLKMSVRIVGIIADQNLSGPGTSPTRRIYLPLRGPLFIFAVPMYVITEGTLSTAATETIINPILDRDVPGLAVTNSSDVASALRQLLRAVVVKAAVINAGAVSIAAIAYSGLYVSLLYTVRRRTLEAGIRMCCGADPRRIVMLVVRQALSSGIVGAGLGWVLARVSIALAANGMEESQRHDTAILLCVTLGCVLLALAMSTSPALKLARLSPAQALRHL
jgi:ABC-type antimicrobial peptide transport system permease subunit